mgnify:CR=1 FL=1
MVTTMVIVYINVLVKVIGMIKVIEIVKMMIKVIRMVRIVYSNVIVIIVCSNMLVRLVSITPGHVKLD